MSTDLLENIIPSKVRRKILQLFYHHPDNTYYLREVVRQVNEEVNAVKRELDILHDAKVLSRERRTNKVFYVLNKSYLLYDEFLRIFTKTSLLSEQVTTNLSRLGKVKYIAVSTKYSKKTPKRHGNNKRRGIMELLQTVVHIKLYWVCCHAQARNFCLF